METPLCEWRLEIFTGTYGVGRAVLLLKAGGDIYFLMS
jgi:hypothetical protein